MSSKASGGGGSSSGSRSKSPSHKKKEEKRTSEGRKYAQIPKESIALYAETIFERIGDDITKPMAEDVSYRLREIINGCSTYLAQANRNYLTTEDVNRVLENMDVLPIFGHAGGGSVNFSYVKEASLFIEEDPEIDVVQLALSHTSLSQKGNHYIKSLWLLPKRGSEEKRISEETPEAGPSSGVTPVSTESEHQIPIPSTLVNYYKHAYRVITGYSKRLFEVLSKDFRTNIKLGPVLPYIVENIATCLQEADRNGQHIIWLLNATDCLTDNKAVDLSPSLSVNKLIGALLYCALDIKVRTGNYISADEDLRQRNAFILNKVLRRWCGSVVVREVLHKVSSLLQDFDTPLQVHRGALHVLTAMGEASLSLCLWPLLIPPGNYNKFLDVIQTVPEIIVDYEALKNIILTAAEQLHPINHIRDEYGEIDVAKKRTSADIEREELAVEIQQILYQQFGDAVCARWRMMRYTARPVAPPPNTDFFESSSHLVPHTYTPKPSITSTVSDQEPIGIAQVFEQAGPLLPSMKQSTSLNDSTDSIFNVDSSSLVQLQCKSRTKPTDTHKTFISALPKTSKNVYWTGKIRKSRFLAFRSSCNLQCVI